MLVSPAEPVALRALGETSSLPETFGCDFLFVGKDGLCGVQRKEVDDLVSSLADGRMARLLDDMSKPDLKVAVMLVEGQFWWERGDPPPRFGHFGAPQWRGFEVSIQMQGCVLVRTRSLEQTAVRLVELEAYFANGSTDSLLRVPKRRGVPGRLRPLMACDGVSLTRARAIDDAGVHLEWSCTEKEMASLKGLGKVTARKLGEHIAYRSEP
jgi:ERCC4-type nuclease